MIEPPSPLLSDKMEIKSSSKTWLDLKVLLANPLNSSIVTSLLSKRVWSSFSIRLWTPGWLWNRCALKTRSNNPGYFYRNQWGGRHHNSLKNVWNCWWRAHLIGKGRSNFLKELFQVSSLAVLNVDLFAQWKGLGRAQDIQKHLLKGGVTFRQRMQSLKKIDDFKNYS